MVTNLLLPVTQLIIEGATAIAIFVRCFSDKNGIEQELKRKLYVEFPRSVLATISVINVVSNLHHNHHSVTSFQLHTSLAGFADFNDSLWFSSNGTAFFLSCGSHTEGTCQFSISYAIDPTFLIICQIPVSQ